MELSLTNEDFKSKIHNAGILNDRIEKQIETANSINHAQNITNHFIKLKNWLRNHELNFKQREITVNFDFDWAYQNIDRIQKEAVDFRFKTILSSNSKKSKKKKQRIRFANKVKKVNDNGFGDNWLTKKSVFNIYYIGIMYDQ